MFDSGDGSMLGNLIEIIVVDLILSGDNALLIGIVASGLVGKQRRYAIIVGAGAAVVLRIAFAVIAVQLLQFPFLAAAGGVALFWVGWRLLSSDSSHSGSATKASSFRQAVMLILLADVVMSLDNILSVAGAAHGNTGLLVFGLVLSIPLLFVGSGVIAAFTGRLPLLIYVGAAVIFRIGAVLIAEDQAVHGWIEQIGGEFFFVHILPWLAAVLLPLIYVAVARLRGRPVNPIMAPRGS